LKATFQDVKIELIDRPEDVARLDIQQKEIESLADSIRERGLQQPIKVAARGDRFKLVFGDRRFLACKLLGGKDIKAMVVEANDGDIAIDRAIENIHRVDLTPVEEGLQYRDMIERMGMSREQVAQMVSKDLHVIRRRLNLLEYPDKFLNAVQGKKVTLSVAEELMSCRDPAHRDYLLEMAVEHGVTKDVARMWVEDWRKSVRKKPSASGEGGGEEPLSFQRKSYIACGLCDEPVEVTEVVSITICGKCKDRMYDMLNKGEHEREGG